MSQIHLSITESAYGFIGEVLHTEEGQPYVKMLSITNIAWNEETRRFYNEIDEFNARAD